MKKYSIPICVVILIISMCFCAFGQGAITVNANPVTMPIKEGIAPYNFTERERELLKNYDMDWFNAPMISYKAPAEAKRMYFYLYQLRDGVWQEWKQCFGIEIPDDMPDAAPFKGNIALQFQKDEEAGEYWIDIHLNDKNCDGHSRADYSELVDFKVMAYGGRHIEEHQAIELGKPIPVAMLIYNDESHLMGIGNIQEHFEPEHAQYLDNELTVALMVTFSE